MNEITMDMTVNPETILDGIEESYPSALKQIQQKSIEKDEDFSVEYTAKKGIFTAKDLEELKEQSNVPKNLN